MTCCAPAFNIAGKSVSVLQVSGYSDALTYMREAGGATRVNGDQIEESVNKSLARLGTDYIDLLQVSPVLSSHHPVLFCRSAWFLTLRPCWLSVFQCHARFIRLNRTVPRRPHRFESQGMKRGAPFKVWRQWACLGVVTDWMMWGCRSTGQTDTCPCSGPLATTSTRSAMYIHVVYGPVAL